jgi:TBC1 domain family protein 5
MLTGTIHVPQSQGARTSAPFDDDLNDRRVSAV